MHLIALIPARSGSKGIPGKNIKELGGKPLMAWSIETALKIVGKSNVFVSTDSPEYMEIAINAGALAIERPARLAADDSTDYDVIKHFKSAFDIDVNTYIVYLRPTTPLRDINVIKAAIEQWKLYHADFISMRSVQETPEPVDKCFKIIGGQLCCAMDIGDDIDRANYSRQSYTPSYQGNGYIDIIDPYFVQFRKLYGTRSMAFITPRVTEADTPDDWEYLEYQARVK